MKLINFSFCIRRAVSIVILFISIYIEAQQQQTRVVYYRPTVATVVGSNISNAFSSMQNAQKANANLSAEISKARKEYWDKYPNKPGFIEAERRFEELFLSKTFGYFIYNLRMGGGDRSKYLEMSGGKIDGGLWPEYEYEFKQWAYAFEDVLFKDDPTFLKYLNEPQRIIDAIDQTKDKYLTFINKRNIAEYLAAVDGLEFKNDKAYTLAIISLKKQDLSQSECNDYYNGLVKKYGEKELLFAAKSVRSSTIMKNEFGYIFSPQFLGPFHGPHPFDGLIAALSNENGKAYLQVLFTEKTIDNNGHSYPDLYEHWLNEIGEQQLVEAANQLRVIPHLRNGAMDRSTNKYRALAQKYNLQSVIPEEVLPIMCGRQSPKYTYHYGASLDSDDNKLYAVALIKSNNSDMVWDDAYRVYRGESNRFSNFLNQYDGESKNSAIEKVRLAPKNGKHQLTNPQALGVDSSNPLDALKELLESDISPKQVFMQYFNSYWEENNRRIDSDRASSFYSYFNRAYGEDQVNSVVERVRNCIEKGEDCSKMEGSVSNFSDPLYLISDVLNTTVSPEIFLSNVLDINNLDNLYKKFGKENVISNAKKLALAPKTKYNYNSNFTGYRGYMRLANPSSLGLEENKTNLIVAFYGLLRSKQNNSGKNDNNSAKSKTENTTNKSSKTFSVGQKVTIKHLNKWKKYKIISKNGNLLKLRTTNLSGAKYNLEITVERLEKLMKPE